MKDNLNNKLHNKNTNDIFVEATDVDLINYINDLREYIKVLELLNQELSIQIQNTQNRLNNVILGITNNK